MREPRRSALLLAEPADELAGKEGRRGLVLRVDGRRPGYGVDRFASRTVNVWIASTGIDALGLQPGQPRLLMLRQELAHAEPGQDALIACQPGVAGRKQARIERHVGIA